MDRQYRILVLNGPNLGVTGLRETQIYGTNTLETINSSISEAALTLNVSLEFFQSNHEGALIDRLNKLLVDNVSGDPELHTDGVIINAGALTHYSFALRDAIAGAGIPAVEVHISNVDAREDFRRDSVIAPVCIGSVSGFGGFSYHLALAGLIEMLKNRYEN